MRHTLMSCNLKLTGNGTSGAWKSKDSRTPGEWFHTVDQSNLPMEGQNDFLSGNMVCMHLSTWLSAVIIDILGWIILWMRLEDKWLQEIEALNVDYALLKLTIILVCYVLSINLLMLILSVFEVTCVLFA